MTSPETQRHYRAPCPGCGAPVEFRSAQSTHAVCGFCRSTVLRSGDTLSRVGRMAEVFDDHSPLQLLATGRFEGRAFTLVGRLQYRSETGNWTEWEATFDDGGRGYLAEDQGGYVFALPAQPQRALPPASAFRVGATTAIDGESFQVAAVYAVSLVSAQGELPHLPPTQTAFAMVELRNDRGEVLSLDYGSTPPEVSRGREVRLEDLSLAGLRDDNAKAEQGRHFACPNCGAPVDVHLAESRSVTCRACNSLIDLGQGAGAPLAHAAQGDAVQPAIPLGATGQLQGVHWQVVGFLRRTGHDPHDPEERFHWDEYLLYNRKRGFVFLVDSSEGWSLVKPTTGAPQWRAGAQTASYLGTTYQLRESYQAETTWAAGEFYWPVERGQKSFNRDFAKGRALLSMEETPRERTWSSGNQISSDTVAKAFRLQDRAAMLQRGDAGPTTARGAGAGAGCITVIFIFVLIVVLIGMLKACDEGGWSSSGGGYSSGSRSGGWSGGSGK